MMGKDSFVIHKSFYEPVKVLSDTQLGKLFRAIFEYQTEKKECKDCEIMMAFNFFKNQFRHDEERYEKVVNRNKTNGLTGGRPKTQDNPKNPVGFQKPKKPDNDNDNDKRNRIKKSFAPPPLEDVKAYFKENGYTEQSATTAFKFYDVADWVDSKGNKVRNWKQKMINVWFKEENKIKAIEKKMHY